MYLAEIILTADEDPTGESFDTIAKCRDWIALMSSGHTIGRAWIDGHEVDFGTGKFVRVREQMLHDLQLMKDTNLKAKQEFFDYKTDGTVLSDIENKRLARAYVETENTYQKNLNIFLEAERKFS